MPAQKRAFDAMEGDPPQRHQGNHSEPPEGGDGYESDRSPSWSNGEKDEFVVVKLAEIRKEVQCPICLGIIRKTRTVMECLHRFCRECIDKSMRLGNNECPACRTHCASRRSLRDDPNYDNLIAALYPDIDKYEQEELAFHDEEKNRNKQIQASIAQTFRRQSEALGRKRTAKATAAAFARRSQGNYRRGRRNSRAADLLASEDDEDANGNDGGKDSSSSEDHSAEVKPKRSRRWGGVRFSQPSLGAANADGGGDENEVEQNRETMGISAGLVGNSEILAWGKGGMRSHTRYGSLSGGNGKNARSSRLSKLADYLRNLEQNNDELDIHLRLVSLDEERIPSLQTPYLCCRPTLSVRHLCQYVALQTTLLADEVEILVIKEQLPKQNPSNPSSEQLPKQNPSNPSSAVDPCSDRLQSLEAQETLQGLKSMCDSDEGHLVLAYRRKSSA